MSKNIANRNNGSSDEYGHLLLLTRLFGGGGVAEGLAVVAQTSPSMNVVVSQGSALIPTGTYPSSYAYNAWIDTVAGSPAGEVVAITTASSSNPRIDAVVMYVDLSITPSSGTANNTNNMLKVAAVAGTPNASPVAPTNSAIQSAIGGSNPFIILANVLVGTSVTQINNGNITDLRTAAFPNLRSGQVGGVKSYNNPGTAGGTFFYMNLGGLKLFWGNTATQTSSALGNTYGITLPSGFFTTVQSITAVATLETGDTRQYVSVNGATTSNIPIQFICPGGTNTLASSIFVVGT